MSFELIAAKIVSGPKRKAVLTNRSKMNKENLGRFTTKSISELAEFLEEHVDHAVVIEADNLAIAIYIDKSTGKYAVSEIPTSINMPITSKISKAEDAVKAAFNV